MLFKYQFIIKNIQALLKNCKWNQFQKINILTLEQDRILSMIFPESGHLFQYHHSKYI
jgi:hypothetical protein